MDFLILCFMEKPLVSLVLSGGGARGIAHIGVIEELPIPYAAVAVDLISKEEVVFRKGSLFEAIRASVSIPSVLTPVKSEGRLLVDGGVLNNIPISHAHRVPGDILVVVNVNASIAVVKPEISSEEREKQKRAYQKKTDEFQAYVQKILHQRNLNQMC
jgi:NTE family protein